MTRSTRALSFFHSAVLLPRASQQFLIGFYKAKAKAKYSHLVETKLKCFTAVLCMSVLCFAV